MNIGGNITAIIQTSTVQKNAIGETVQTWQDAQTIRGWLDLASGDSRYNSYLSKVQESTHILICDFVPLAEGIQAETSRMTINGKNYDIMLIDNPMEMNEQLEIYLKHTGGQ